MIDVHHLAQDIVGRNEVGGIGSAVRATTEGLSRCWDDCAAVVLDAVRRRPNEPIDQNPYRLALELTDGPNAPRVEFVDEPLPPGDMRHVFITSVDDDELAAMQIVVQALDGLDQRAQNRVITYISERMA